MKKSLTFSDAVEGYLLAATARHLSKNTIADYINTFRKFHIYLDDDPIFEEITKEQIEGFLAAQTVAKKTVLNYLTGLSALWTWAVDNEIVQEQIVHSVSRPKPEKRSIVPYSQDDVKAMLDALTHSSLYTRPGKGKSQHSLPNQERNRAIILLLLDTGIRATELCELKIHQLDLQNRRITVFGKGSKERTIPISHRTAQAIWRYLKTERQEDYISERLFTTLNGRPMDRDRLLKSIRSIGKRAHIERANVHRFRHTFAINYLRNGGDPFSLQMSLGHSTMEMVKNYLALAQADLEKNHLRASPVDHWRL
jgi:site-specific recombinase XerD